MRSIAAPANPASRLAGVRRHRLRPGGPRRALRSHDRHAQPDAAPGGMAPRRRAVSPHCHVQGQVSPGLTWYVQLPPPEAWNGRFLHWGDGGHDGDLDYAPHRVAQGYAVANSNMGHDSGSQPGATWAFNNRQAEIVYGYRHLEVTTAAARRAIRAYYGRPADHAYHEGCSTGGASGADGRATPAGDLRRHRRRRAGLLPAATESRPQLGHADHAQGQLRRVASPSTPPATASSTASPRPTC